MFDADEKKCQISNRIQSNKADNKTKNRKKKTSRSESEDDKTSQNNQTEIQERVKVKLEHLKGIPYKHYMIDRS